jgi:hypothetical protein
MLTMIHNALAGRATRWIAAPTLAVAAVAAVVLTVSAGTIPGLGISLASRTCSPERPAACGHPAVATRISAAERMVKSAPLKVLPALPATSRQPAAPMTRNAATRQARIQAALKTYFSPATR